MKKASKDGIPFSQKEGDSISCLTEKVPAPMRDGCLAFKLSGFI